MFKPKCILVPIDFSSESELALEWAVMMVRGESGAAIELCHIIPNIYVPTGPESMTFDYAGYYELQRLAAEKKLNQWQRRVQKEIVSECVVRKGGIAGEIEKLCREKSIDLVIMTTHGRQGLSHLLHGSTTEETVRVAPCPVLVLHLNKDAHASAQVA